MTVLSNDHLLITYLLDVCEQADCPTLIEALKAGESPRLFRSTERLAPCPEIGQEGVKRVCHDVYLDSHFGFAKPVRIAYHVEHLVSSTGKMVLKKLRE